MISRNKLDEIKDLKESGMSREELAEQLEVTLETMNRYLRYLRSYENNNECESNKKQAPKIIILDIETAPCLSTVWGVYKQIIPLCNIRKEWYIISWSAKYLFDSNIMSDVLTPEEALKGDDERILKSVWDILDKGDIIVGHNLQRFDLRKINARFIVNGLLPPSPYRTIDTLAECKKYFAFTGYTLDYINGLLGLSKKLDSSYSLWLGCINGDNKSLKKMEKYNKQDIILSEELYLKIRPWIKSHPNVALHTDLNKMVCSNCGNENIKENGIYYTPAGRFISYRCDNCGAFSRNRYSDLTKDQRKNLLTSVAR